MLIHQAWFDIRQLPPATESPPRPPLDLKRLPVISFSADEPPATPQQRRTPSAQQQAQQQARSQMPLGPGDLEQRLRELIAGGAGQQAPSSTGTAAEARAAPRSPPGPGYGGAGGSAAAAAPLSHAV